ncbi:hypothetical protein GOV12_02405 [Candidatus Pacearchaeota archaeon]|nr:hypothetical protein [Candidatus Pacearchaeota archaeon]
MTNLSYNIMKNIEGEMIGEICKKFKNEGLETILRRIFFDAFSKSQYEAILPKILIKTNDGRGRGHISRVSNWVGNPPINNDVLILVNKEFSDMVPRTINYETTEDTGWRINHREQKPQQYKFKSPANVDPFTETLKYYSCIIKHLHGNLKLFYVDDQNSPETLFLSRIGEMCGISLPDIKDKSPNAKIANEMETQVPYNELIIEGFDASDYIHLSSSFKFMDFATKKTWRTWTPGLEEKVIEMGFPLSEERKEQLDLPQSEKDKRKKDIIERYNPNCKNLVYCSFGGGEGADTVYPIIVRSSKDHNDVLFTLGDGPNIREILRNAGFSIEEIEKNGKVIGAKVNGQDNFYLVRSIKGGHLGAVATADINIQGCGSGTTYEGIWAGNPIIALPLNRPGNEQIIKAIGVEKSGGGRALYLDDLLNTNGTKVFFQEVGYNNSKTKVLNSNNLNNAISAVLKDSNKIRDSLQGMRKYFGRGNLIAAQVGAMAESLTVEDIQKNFKPY